MTGARCAVCDRRLPVTHGYAHRCSGKRGPTNVAVVSHASQAMLTTVDGRRFVSREERKRVVQALRAGGSTLQEIGDYLGVTRERVRQILDEPGVGSGRRHTTDPARIVRTLRDPATASIADLARRSGTAMPSLLRCLRETGLLPAASRLLRWRQSRALRARHEARQARLRPILEAFIARHGRFPTATECNNHVEGLPAAPSVQLAWGMYNSAAKSFGFNARGAHGTYYP